MPDFTHRWRSAPGCTASGRVSVAPQKFSRVIALALITVAALAAACAPAPEGGGDGFGYVEIPPGTTDPELSNDPLYPNFAIPAAGTPRGRLVVLFNGTGAGPSALAAMGNKLAADGYHVIGLRYSSGVGTQSACSDSAVTTWLDCHREFRSEVVFGAGVGDPDGYSANHPAVSVNAAGSVVNRLIKLVDHLTVRFPVDGWNQYQDRPDGDCVESPHYGGCEIDWTKVVAMGHSQGAGVALYLGKQFPLARVAMLSGAYDAFYLGSDTFTVAPWVTEGGFETPISSIATFSHLNDYGLGIQRAVADGLGLPGPEVNVTTTARPYGGASRIVTNVTPSCLLDSNGAHNSTATDGCSPPGVHSNAWRYLAGGA